MSLESKLLEFLRNQYGAIMAAQPEDLPDVAATMAACVQGDTSQARALWHFAQLVQPEDRLEYIAYEDGSGEISAIRNGHRVASLTIQMGQSDGRVYDLAGKLGHIVYPKEE